MASLKQYLKAALVLFIAVGFSSAFYHHHHLMTALLLASSLQRNSFVPLPIPIPIPVKAGGNTIIAMDDGFDDGVVLAKKAPVAGCHRPPCPILHGRRVDYW